MYTLYQITPPHMTSTKIIEMKSLGELRKHMNGMKQAAKSNLYAIYDDKNRLMSSMVNK
jgi:hypothetical protein